MSDPFGISAGASALGGGTTEAAGYYFQNRQMQANTHSARNWAERMSNTAYRRAVVDLREAGLNPMLAYTQGGASAPTLGAAPVPDLDMGEAVAKGIESGKSAAMFASQVGQQKALQKKAEADAESAKNFSDVSSERAQAEIARAWGDYLRSGSQAAAADASARLTGALETKAVFEQDRVKAETEYLRTQREKLRHGWFGGVSMPVTEFGQKLWQGGKSTAREVWNSERKREFDHWLTQEKFGGSEEEE